MNKYILFLSILCLSLVSYAAEKEVKGTVIEEKTSEPIVGANIYWAGTSIGTITDINGQFSLHIHTGEHTELVVSFVGYRSDTIKINDLSDDLSIVLSPSLELDAVTVAKRRAGTYYSSLSPVQSQKVTGAELQKAACCNLSESFETNASIDVAYSDAVTGAKQIKMMGLSGNYVQTINENMPSMRGMAAVFGLGYTPGPWMESIQISKGTSSVSNGYEAVTGQINVEYKKPNGQEKLHFNAYGNDAGKIEINLNASDAFNDSLSTMILFHGENLDREIDENGDNFLDIPKIRQVNFMNRWNYHTPKTHRTLDLKILDEQRNTGQLGADVNDPSTGYGIQLATKRYEIVAKNGIVFDKPGTSLGIQAAASYHNQNSIFGFKDYSGTQYNEYLNLIFQSNLGTDLHSYKLGASFMGDQLTEALDDVNYEHLEFVPGVFGEYNLNMHGLLSVIVGMRADYSSLHGLFFTPRLHAKLDISEHIVFRSSVGKGYRTSIPLAENSYFLASSRSVEIADNLAQEEALNYGANISFKIPVSDRLVNLMFDYYRTDFRNQVVRDLDRDAHKLYLSNLDGESFSNAFQVELNGEILPRFSATLAYRINDVKQTTNGMLQEAPLISKSKGLVSFSYATPMEKWQFDVTAQINGGGRMPTPDAENPLWETIFDPYNVFNAQITKNYKRWSFYLGGENLASFTMDNPIIDASNPWGNNFDGSMIWGPVHGRKVYLGLRYTFKDY